MVNDRWNEIIYDEIIPTRTIFGDWQSNSGSGSTIKYCSSTPNPQNIPKPKNATLKALSQLNQKHHYDNAMTGSKLLNSLIDKSPVILEAKIPRVKHAKSTKIAIPKVMSKSVEATANVHPFILEHRVGTTERITSMDPMGEEFIKSLRIKYNGKYSTKEVSPAQQFKHDVLNAIASTHVSQVMKKAIPETAYLEVTSLHDLGTPWTESGWILPSFMVTTGVMTKRDHVAFDKACFLLDLWTHRPPEFISSRTTDAGGEVKATLVNKFEALRGRLVCYSFIVEADLKIGHMSQGLIHIWVNKNYLDDARLLPMYFEEAGARLFMFNALVANLGFQIEADGRVVFQIKDGEVVKSHVLNESQVCELIVKCYLPPVESAKSRGSVNWKGATNADWEGLGYAIQLDGVKWQQSLVINTLPWQVREQRLIYMKDLVTFRRATNITEQSGYSPRTFYEVTGAARKALVSQTIAKQFWKSTREASHSHFDPLLKELRQDFISTSIVKEMKQLWPEMTGPELLDAVNGHSDKQGRFVFERSIPKAI